MALTDLVDWETGFIPTVRTFWRVRRLNMSQSRFYTAPFAFTVHIHDNRYRIVTSNDLTTQLRKPVTWLTATNVNWQVCKKKKMKHWNRTAAMLKHTSSLFGSWLLGNSLWAQKKLVFKNTVSPPRPLSLSLFPPLFVDAEKLGSTRSFGWGEGFVLSTLPGGNCSLSLWINRCRGCLICSASFSPPSCRKGRNL